MGGKKRTPLRMGFEKGNDDRESRSGIRPSQVRFDTKPQGGFSNRRKLCFRSPILGCGTPTKKQAPI